MAITVNARPTKAQVSYKGYTIITQTMEESAFLQYIALASVQQQIDVGVSRLMANGFMPELVIVNGGESVRFLSFSISPTPPNYFDAPRR